MICHICGEEGVLNECLGKQFYYCRTCKNEIMPILTEVEEEDPFDIIGWGTADSIIFNSIGGPIKIMPNTAIEVPDGYTFLTSKGVVKVNDRKPYCEGGSKLVECDCGVCALRHS